MKCASCGNEMFISGAEVDGNRETFVYKCPNPGCQNYGYAKPDKPVSGADGERPPI